MGFGSYDESEQDDGSQEIETENTVSRSDDDHGGKVSFDTGESTSELVSRLSEMRDDDADDA